MKIIPKNWQEFQHYKHRTPPWIRLHRNLLDNFEFHSLPVASRALAPMLWLIASDSVEGEVDASAGKLSFRLRMTDKEVDAALKPLIEGGFFIVSQGASEMLASSLQDADSEKRQSRDRDRDKLASARATAGLNLEAFDSWITYRKEIGKPVKPASYEACAAEMAKLGAKQMDTVNHSKAQGYQGLFAPKTNGHQPPEPTRSRAFPS